MGEEIKWTRPSSDSSSHRGRTSRADAEARGPGGEGERGVETVVGVSVIDAAADWSLEHAYTGTETKARLGGLGVWGGNQR